MVRHFVLQQERCWIVSVSWVHKGREHKSPVSQFPFIKICYDSNKKANNPILMTTPSYKYETRHSKYSPV